MGLDGISIGTETGDDEVLTYMNKGNTSADTIEQCHKLEQAGYLPYDRERIAGEIEHTLTTVNEQDMLEYRQNLKALG